MARQRAYWLTAPGASAWAALRYGGAGLAGVDRRALCVAGMAPCGGPTAGGLAAGGETVIVDTPEPERTRWPEHLRVGALRVVRWSAHYDQTVIFYRDIIGLPVL